MAVWRDFSIRFRSCLVGFGCLIRDRRFDNRTLVRTQSHFHCYRAWRFFGIKRGSALTSMVFHCRTLSTISGLSRGDGRDYSRMPAIQELRNGVMLLVWLWRLVATTGISNVGVLLATETTAPCYRAANWIRTPARAISGGPQVVVGVRPPCSAGRTGFPPPHTVRPSA